MRLSAGRIRSLATRYALAEAAAFPVSSPNPMASPPTANPRPISSTAGCAFAHQS